MDTTSRKFTFRGCGLIARSFALNDKGVQYQTLQLESKVEEKVKKRGFVSYLEKKWQEGMSANPKHDLTKTKQMATTQHGCVRLTRPSRHHEEVGVPNCALVIPSLSTASAPNYPFLC